MHYNNEDNCSSKDPIFDLCIDIRNYKDFHKDYDYVDTYKFEELLKSNNYNSLTKFEKSLLYYLASYNMMESLSEKKGFKFNWTREDILDTKYYKHNLNLIDLRFIYEVSMYWCLNSLRFRWEFYSIFRRDFCDKYPKSIHKDDNDYKVYGTNFYSIYKFIKDSNKIEIFDKGDYIMFRKVSPNFHLERTDNNDVEWTKDKFKDAFIRMFNLYINE